MVNKGTMTFYYSDYAGETVKFQFTTADLETPAAEIKSAATLFGSSVVSGLDDEPLIFRQATGVIETVLATAES